MKLESQSLPLWKLHVLVSTCLISRKTRPKVSQSKRQNLILHLHRSPATISVALGTQRIAKFNETGLNTVNIYLAVIRLPDKSTDIVISYNHTVELAETSSSRTLARAEIIPADVALSNFQNVLKSFRIVNYDLFI